MKKDIFYCEQWSYGYKELHKPFSEKQAEIWRDYITLESHDLAEGYTYFFNENTDDCYVLKEDFINNERYEKTELYPQKDKVILFPKFGEYDLVLNPDII